MGLPLYLKISMILLLILCIILILSYKSCETFFTQAPSLDIVVARYQEDISWIQNIPYELYDGVFIYNKGDNTDFIIDKSELIKLPNLGRESHTYLHHVIQNYHNLAKLTFFVPGSAWYRDDKKQKVLRIIEYLKNGKDNKESYMIVNKNINDVNEAYKFSIDSYPISNEANSKKNSDSSLIPSSERPLGKWFNKHFPNEKLTSLSYTGILLVSREDIRKKPIEFYKKLLEEHSHINAEVVHYSERVWKHIFSVDEKNCTE